MGMSKLELVLGLAGCMFTPVKHLQVKDQFVFVSCSAFLCIPLQKGMMQCGAQELAFPCYLLPKGTVFALSWQFQQ